MNDPRHHNREPGLAFRAEDGLPFRVELTTDLETHEAEEPSEENEFEEQPAGRWAMCKTMFFVSDAWVVKGAEFRVWDPWQSDDSGYQLSEGDEAKVQYCRQAKRLEFCDQPCT